MNPLDKMKALCEGLPEKPATAVVPNAKLSWWQRFQCRLFCPGFDDERPPHDEPGQWTAVAIIDTMFRGSWEASEVTGITSLQRAYDVSRWLALQVDRATPRCHGVRYAVRKQSV